MNPNRLLPVAICGGESRKSYTSKINQLFEGQTNMTRQEFMRQLDRLLGDMPEQDRLDAGFFVNLCQRLFHKIREWAQHE